MNVIGVIIYTDEYPDPLWGSVKRILKDPIQSIESLLGPVFPYIYVLSTTETIDEKVFNVYFDGFSASIPPAIPPFPPCLSH